LRVLVVGGGGREHALVWKLGQSGRVDHIVCAPGNAGTAMIAENAPVRVNDIDELVTLAKDRRIDLAMIGPEEPLSLGLVDRLTEEGILACGPTQAAARIETSKSWAKSVMHDGGVTTARATVAFDLETAVRALDEFTFPVVIKADGLAAGKGVIIAETEGGARATLEEFMSQRSLGNAGETVVLEEFMTGMEISLTALTDGTTVVPLIPACDYKRALDGDLGLNTGGMGSYAPVPEVDDAMLQGFVESIFKPTIRTMAERGAPMKGVLYAGLMLTPTGPKVLEFNARLGDPETQVILPLLESDLAELLLATVEGRLDEVSAPTWSSDAAVAVVLASGGYPGMYAVGREIHGLDGPNQADSLVFQAGTALDQDGKVVTSGGRVISVVGRGQDHATARHLAYERVKTIEFDQIQYRTDIAGRVAASS
jgi:phosphoribosylamine---glycine ligase